MGAMTSFKDFIEELKIRVLVSDVVRRHVKLKQRGREWVGLSPFTREKTPSFTVNDEKQFWHCFSSAKHGDIFSFLTETQNLSFREAVQEIASLAGIDVPQFERRPSQEEDTTKKLYELMEVACVWFQKQLFLGAGVETRAYLKSRGISEQAIKTFRLGFAPLGLAEFLQSQGFSETLMLEGGLLAKKDDGSVYERFRNRLIFPITDTHNKVIAFGGRAQDPQARAKYLNSPETPLFHKGRVLYGFFEARKNLADKTLVVVEGYMDVLALHGAGLGCVAGMGTAVTEAQLRLLWRLVPEPVFCFDGDEAGVRALHRVMDLVLSHLRPGFSVRFARLPPGEDPDDMVRRQGVGAFESLVGKSSTLIDALWERERANARTDTPEQRAVLDGVFERLASSIRDRSVRYHFQRMMRQRLRDFFAPSAFKNFTPPPPVPPYREPREGGAERERLILGMLLNFPFIVERRQEVLWRAHFASPPHEELCAEILRLRENGVFCESVVEQLGSEFQMLLGEVSGESYTRRFPLSRLGLEEDFVLRCFDHLLALQNLRALEEDVAWVSELYADQLTEEHHKRLVHFKEEIHKGEEKIEGVAKSLMEEVKTRFREKTDIDWGGVFSPSLP